MREKKNAKLGVLSSGLCHRGSDVVRY